MGQPATYAHLTRDPAILGGALAIAGSRVSVRLIGAYVRQGLGPTDILDSYPFLNPAAVQEAIAYYHAHQAEIDAELDREENDRG